MRSLRERMGAWCDRVLWWILPETLYRWLPDHCEVCHGRRGGVRGNENVVTVGERPVIMCDYCSAKHLLVRP